MAHSDTALVASRCSKMVVDVVAVLTLSTTKNGDDAAAATFAVRCGNATLWAPDGESTAAAAASLSGNGDSSNGDGGSSG